MQGEIFHAIHRHAKANNKYMKNYHENIELSYLIYLNANNLYGWAMSQNVHVNCFEWVEELPQFNKNYDEDSNNIFLK